MYHSITCTSQRVTCHVTYMPRGVSHVVGSFISLKPDVIHFQGYSSLIWQVTYSPSILMSPAEALCQFTYPIRWQLVQEPLICCAALPSCQRHHSLKNSKSRRTINNLWTSVSSFSIWQELQTRSWLWIRRTSFFRLAGAWMSMTWVQFTRTDTDRVTSKDRGDFANLAWSSFIHLPFQYLFNSKMSVQRRCHLAAVPVEVLKIIEPLLPNSDVKDLRLTSVGF